MKHIIVLGLLSSILACSSKSKKSEPTNFSPKLLAPNVKKIWIPPTIKDGGQEWVEGHFIYKIERGTAWSR